MSGTGAGAPARTWVVAASVTLAVAMVYAAGACPSIYVGDSGELVTAVHVLGIPHPTGYPLYVLVGKLWTLVLPVGSIAYRMSLFSAAAGALSAGLLAATARRMGLGWMAAVSAGLLAAFGPSLWGEATVQRVYALGALFVVGAVGMAWAWYETRRPGVLIALAFWCGLGASNHTVMALIGLAMGLFALVVDPGLLRRLRTMAMAVLAGLAGLLPYAYLPLRSRADPALDWGNPETLAAFLEVVARSDFWGRAWIESPADLGPVVLDFARSLPHELTWGGVGLAAIGAGAMARQGRFWILPALVVLANVVAVALHGSRTDIFVWHRYYIPSYLMGALLAGWGVQAVLAFLPRPARVLPLVLPAILLVTGWPRFDRSRYQIGEAFSRAVLDSVPPGARLVATDDNILFILLYLRFVEGVRPDVHLVLQGVGDADLPPLRFDPETDPVFFTHHPNWHLPELEVVPRGLVFEVRRPGPVPAPILPLLTLPGEDDAGVPKDYLTQNLIGHLHFMLGVTFEERDWERARREFARAMEAAPRNDVLFYNLGLVFRRNGLWPEARAAFARSHAINPRHIASAGRVRAADRLAEVEADEAAAAALERTLADHATLTGLVPGTAAHHLALAALLAGHGAEVAARGHRLRALAAGGV